MLPALTILSVAYALAPVGPDAVGGAEQMLSTLDHALTVSGHRSIVVACRGSEAAGRLIDTGIDPDSRATPAHRAAARSATQEAVRHALRHERVDVVHMHGLDFPDTLPADTGGAPILATLHLPPAWYPALPNRPDLWLSCVSDDQGQTCPVHPKLLPPIPNGVDTARLTARHARRGFALMLGRICPEKGQHLALQAAHRAGLPLLIAGAVFPYPEHQAYFAREVAPYLDRTRRFIGPAGFVRKRRLLTAARCVLIPSLAPETSSLVAMEAAACGTPVLAYPAGALAGIVEQGRTGFLVQDVPEMAGAMHRTGEIAPDTCREVARRRFSLERMVGAYLDRYARLAERRAQAA